MSRKKEWLLLGTGLLVGLALGPTAAHAAEEWFKATPSTQTFYTDGKQVELEAYAINGHNYVKLRDVGQLVDFGVTYDAATNSVHIQPEEHYQPEKKTGESGAVVLPTDGTKYVPQVGDQIPCNDGTLYTITDVSRWENNAFSSEALGDLPTPTCDWSLLDQPDLPAVEARHFEAQGADYCFVRNLYETRRMLYTLYNAQGNNLETWKDGKPVLRADGSPLVSFELSIPETEEDTGSFWPWREEQLTNLFNSCPPGTYQMEAWDVYRNGVFQRTEYNIIVK